MSRTEAFGWGAGVVLLALYAGSELYFSVESRRAVDSFRQSKQLRATEDSSRTLLPPFEFPELRSTTREAEPSTGSSSTTKQRGALAAPTPNTELWSATRIDRFNARASTSSPQAILTIDALDLEVPVYGNTSEPALNQGAGLIEGTAAIGQGNTGLAAHRDGYFRKLGDLEVGDTLDIETFDSSYTYVVSEIRIVAPDAIEVLAPTDDPMLTLVTCYPFYFAGPAPKRYIVRAALEQAPVLANGTT